MRTACLSTPLLVLSAQALSVTHTLSSRLVTSVQCLTHKTNSPVATPIPTSTTTKRLLPSIAVIVEISSPVRTVTASAITVTSSVLTETTVTTTAPATTGTFSSTSILTATETSTVTSAVVSTVIVSTSTSTTSTSIIPAPSGFKPAYDTTGETTLAKHKRRELDQVAHGGALIQRRANQRSNPLLNKYPASVLCVALVQPHWVERVVITGGKTRTSTVPGSPTTTTTTSTQTSTSTLVPEVSTTVTTTSTTTDTITSTAISTDVTTSTSTLVTTSTATSYAACATNNQLGPRIADGRYTDYGPLLVNNANEYSYFYNARSAYDCCVDCVNDRFGNHCQISIFQPNGANPGTCQVLGQPPGVYKPELCNNPGLSVQRVQYTEQPSIFSPLVFSNGPCGVVVDT